MEELEKIAIDIILKTDPEWIDSEYYIKPLDAARRIINLVLENEVRQNG